MRDKEYLRLFLGDAEEQLHAMNQALLVMEENPGDRECLEEFFRGAHNLKGGAATLGFENIARLAHEMEDVLGALRSGKVLICRECVDVLFNCLDTLTKMIGRAQEGKKDDIDIEGTCESLRACVCAERSCSVDGAPAAAADDGADSPVFLLRRLSEYERLEVTDELKQGRDVTEIIIVINDPEGMRGVRCLVIMNHLRAIGDVLKYFPDIEKDEIEQAEKFHILLATEKSEEQMRGQIGESVVSSVEMFPASIYMVDADGPGVEESGGEGSEAAEAAAPGTGKIKKEEDGVSSLEMGRSLTTVRVNTNRLDAIMNLMGEMVINRAQFGQIQKQLLNLESDARADDFPRLLKNLSGEFDNVYQRMRRISTELQERVMRIRLLPISTVFSRFGRLVRDLGAQVGREVELKISGENTELDKTVIEAIGDPLIHIVRNAVYHGIEPAEEREAAGKPRRGTVHLGARQEGNHVVLEIGDDGRGIDAAKALERAVQTGIVSAAAAEKMSEREIMNLIFAPGFSTADRVDDISGRGVGMDVVARNIERLSGVIEVKTRPGKGTKFILRIPLTLAIIQALLVKVSDETYAIPLGNIIEAVRILPSEVKTIEGREVAMMRGAVLSLIRMDEALGLPRRAARAHYLYVVVVGMGEKRIGLVVDALVGRQEIVIKSLEDYFRGIPAIAGASILGDGSVALIIDVYSMIETGLRQANVEMEKRREAKRTAHKQDGAARAG